MSHFNFSFFEFVFFLFLVLLMHIIRQIIPCSGGNLPDSNFIVFGAGHSTGKPEVVDLPGVVAHHRQA